MAMVVQRFDVYLVDLGVTVGVETQKTRPCLIISPNEMNRRFWSVIIAPMTTRGQSYATRIDCRFQGKKGRVVLDQLRAIDKSRLVKRLGKIDVATRAMVLSGLAKMFAP
jgi:mRNA interferase MazF